ncbi:MAG: type II toxin-antitoxin system RelE/ParE family toxin [Deltaproteobacteria bacterium]|nr:type II toxin-antitoxin system RelE/ParE family toxin [Deltaproteobacteria bacterium]
MRIAAALQPYSRFNWPGSTFVMLHHFIKKTPKTPQREIEQDRQNLKDHLTSKGD